MAYVLALGLAVLASQSFQRSVADLYLKKIERLSGKASEKIIARVERALTHAVELDPGNPARHDILAQWYLVKLLDTETDTPEQGNVIERGIQEARLAIAHRPAWPMAWARLLIWKAAANKADAELELALERVTTLGPWELYLHFTVVESALPFWNDLPPGGRQRVLEAAVHGLRSRPESMLTLVRSFGRMADLCASIPPANELFAQYCRAG